MKPLFTLFLFCFFVINSAQKSTADSLLLILKKTKNPEHITKFQNEISEAYKSVDAALMKKYAVLALHSSGKTNNTVQRAWALQNIGISYIIISDYDKALQHLNDSEALLSRQNSLSKDSKQILAKTLGSKGMVFSEQNKYAEALKYDLQAMKIYEELKNSVQLSKIYNNIGVIYNSIEDHPLALKYFLRANQLQKAQQSPAAAVSSSNIGLIYLNQNRKNEAQKYFEESLLLFEKSPDPRGLGELYNNYSRLYISENKYTDAKAVLLKAENTLESIQDQFGLSDTYLLLAEICFEENNLVKSFEFANKSLEMSRKLDFPETKMKAEKLLSEIYDKQGNQKMALVHLKNYDLEKDKLETVENEQLRLKTELNFEYEKSELEKKEMKTRGKLLLVIIAVVLISLFCGLFFYHRNKEREKTVQLQKQLAEFEHKALHLQMNPHFVFNCLAAISSFIMQNGKEDAIKYLSKFSKLMRLTLEFSKESAIPIDKEIEALQNYLELEQLRFSQKFDFSIHKSQEIEDDTAIPALLLQPYVENAIIHGVAPKESRGFIKIDFMLKADYLICTIEDNGIGIETSQKMKENMMQVHKSMALEISKKRLETLEELENKKVILTVSELKNDDGTAKGTLIILELPLKFIKNDL